MKLNMRYQKPTEEPVETEVELHKNSKGYNIRIEGKYYFPNSNNKVINNLSEYENKELWVVVIEDKFNYGNIAFAVPDFFIIPDYEKKEIKVEKEVPLNLLDNPDQPYKWDYITLATVSDPDKTEAFIDKLEAAGCPDQIIRSALDEFYFMRKNIKNN